MQTHFYSHLVEIESLTITLSELDVSSEESEELLSIFHETLHHKILHISLNELQEDDKKQFVTLMLKREHEPLWHLLQANSEDAELKIKHAINTLINEFIQDIHETKKEHVKIR